MNTYYLMISLLGLSTFHATCYIKVKSTSKLQPLHNALLCEDGLDVIKELLKTEDINEQDVFGYTPLHRAILTEQTSAALLLIDKEAKIYILDREGKTPLYYAACAEMHEVVKALLMRGANMQDIEDAAAERAQTKQTKKSVLEAPQGKRKKDTTKKGCCVIS